MLILTLTDLVHLHLVVSLEQEGALRVRAGQNVRFSFESLTGKKFTGKVKSIFPNRNQFFVKIEPDELPPEILPGMTADVAIEVAKKENVLLIPVVSIHNGKVMRIREGKKSKIDVQIGNLDGEWAEVINSDLGVNDEIVIPEKTAK
ncbi:MAG: hypothetical protein N3A69_00545 [Leptospiraceae bacterium]|nr:hypothetical protein [Leptospiraceae bacterium]